MLYIDNSSHFGPCLDILKLYTLVSSHSFLYLYTPLICGPSSYSRCRRSSSDRSPAVCQAPGSTAQFGATKLGCSICVRNSS